LQLAASLDVSYIMDIVAVFLGWPSLLLAAGLAGLGAWRRKPMPVWLAILFSAPVAFYVSGSPAMPLIGLFPIVALTVTALTCSHRVRWPSWISLGIYYSFLLALAGLVAMN
jgi:hypothetical protein